MHRRASLVVVLACAACGPATAPAPGDADGIAHWLWANADAADDAALADAAGKVHDAIDGDGLDPIVRGTLADLTSDELAVVDMTDRDPSTAQGFFFAAPVDCSLDALEEILAAPDQDVLYPDVYDSYQRTYASDHDAFVGGTAPTLAWTTDYGATLVAAKYTTTQKGSLRRVLQADAPHPHVVVARSHMPAPAVFENDADHFPFDFQIETYHARSDGKLAHFYAIWREIRLDGVGLSTDDDAVLDTIFDALVKYDEKTSALCADR